VLNRGDYEVFSAQDIIYFEACHNNCIVIISGRAGGIPISSNISTVLQQLPPNLFRRIHRSYIISIPHIKKINRNKTRIYYKEDKTLPVGESYLPNLLDVLSFIK
jgi:two-component system LytT family response regulator